MFSYICIHLQCNSNIRVCIGHKSYRRRRVYTYTFPCSRRTENSRWPKRNRTIYSPVRNTNVGITIVFILKLRVVTSMSTVHVIQYTMSIRLPYKFRNHNGSQHICHIFHLRRSADRRTSRYNYRTFPFRICHNRTFDSPSGSRHLRKILVYSTDKIRRTCCSNSAYISQ